MIDDIEDGKVNCVVTKDLSRLGRNYILIGQYTEICFPSKSVRYIAVNDNVDTLNDENELALFLNILNEIHARQTSKKVKAALKARRMIGGNGAFRSIASARSFPAADQPETIEYRLILDPIFLTGLAPAAGVAGHRRKNPGRPHSSNSAPTHQPPPAAPGGSHCGTRNTIGIPGTPLELAGTAG